MASIRKVAQDVLEEARDGIAWIALYRVGRGWEAACFWPDIDRDGMLQFDDENDIEQIKEILAVDQMAIFVNGWYTNLGDIDHMSRESLANALRWQYHTASSMLRDAI